MWLLNTPPLSLTSLKEAAPHLTFPDITGHLLGPSQPGILSGASTTFPATRSFAGRSLILRSAIQAILLRGWFRVGSWGIMLGSLCIYIYMLGSWGSPWIPYGGVPKLGQSYEMSWEIRTRSLWGAKMKTYPNPMVYHHFSQKNGMGSIQGQVSTRLVNTSPLSYYTFVEQAYGFQFLGHKDHKLFIEVVQRNSETFFKPYLSWQEW